MKVLSDVYVKGFLTKMATNSNGPKLVSFLEYARYKGISVSDVIRKNFIDDANLKTNVTGNSDVVAKKAVDANFKAFVDSLLPIPVTKIAYIQSNGSFDEIYTINANGTGKLNTSNNVSPETNTAHQAFSPDNSYIAYRGGNGGTGTYDVYRVNSVYD